MTKPTTFSSAAFAALVVIALSLTGCSPQTDSSPNAQDSQPQEPALSCAEWVEQKVDIPQLGTPEAEALAEEYRVPASTAPEDVAQAFIDVQKKAVQKLVSYLPTEADTQLDCVTTHEHEGSEISAAFGLDRFSSIYVMASINPIASNYEEFVAAYTNDYGLIALNTLSNGQAPVASNESIELAHVSADSVQAKLYLAWVFKNDYTIGGNAFPLNATIDPAAQSWVTQWCLC